MAFKMKGSPMQRNFGVDKVKDVVSSVGSKLQEIGKAAGDFKAKRKQVVADKAKASPDGLTNYQRRRAEKKSRNPGESKFQADIRRKREARKASKAKEEVVVKSKEGTNKPKYDIRSSSIFEPTKFGHEGKSLFSPTTTDLDRAMIVSDMKNRKITQPKSKYGLNTGGSNTEKKQENKNQIASKVVKEIDYSKAKSVNALVALRTKWKKNNPNKRSREFPGQSEINKRLKENPGQWGTTKTKKVVKKKKTDFTKIKGSNTYVPPNSKKNKDGSLNLSPKPGVSKNTKNKKGKTNKNLETFKNVMKPGFMHISDFIKRKV